MPREGFDVRAGPEWRRVAIALREVDASLPTWLRRRLKEAVKPLADEAKQDIRTMPVRGTAGSTGLRRRIARGVSLRAGVGKNPSIRAITSMADPSEAALPRGFESPEGWRHPVFGHSDVWVRQVPQRPGWFAHHFTDGRDDIQRALTDVMEEARDRIAEAGGRI